jgi:hypothetical protein
VFGKMSFSRSGMLGIAALSLFAAPAMYAGPITFIATGALVDGATLSGNVVINTTTGVVQSANLSVTSPISLSGLTFDNSGPGGLPSGQGVADYSLFADLGNLSSFVVLDLPATTLVGYTGGNICLSSCGGFGSSASFASNSYQNSIDGSEKSYVGGHRDTSARNIIWRIWTVVRWHGTTSPSVADHRCCSQAFNHPHVAILDTA